MSFSSMYRPDNEADRPAQDVSRVAHLEKSVAGIASFFEQFAGMSFNQGLYRIHSVNEMTRWTANVVEAFPNFKKRILCFSYDWLGRHFAIDGGRTEKGQCQLLMLEPGTGSALQIPAKFKDFHDIELVEYQSNALASEFFMEWLNTGGESPNLSQCIGYKKPLFLGGVDDLENLELTDMEVYWSISGQLLAKTRDLPPGTKIGGIDIK